MNPGIGGAFVIELVPPMHIPRCSSLQVIRELSCRLKPTWATSSGYGMLRKFSIRQAAGRRYLVFGDLNFCAAVPNYS